MLTYEIYNPTNISQKFIRLADGRTYHFGADGILYSEGGNPAMQVQIGEEWELVPQEVTWQEGLQSWVDGKEVEVEYMDKLLGQVKGAFIGFRTIGLCEDAIKNGKWFVK